MAKKKNQTKKRKPTKRAPTKRKPTKRKPTKRGPTKKSESKKEKKRGVIGSAIHKIPEKVRIKGGKSKSASESKYGSVKMETEYKDLEVGK